MGLFLNFGPGENMLPDPWLNLEPNHDIRKRLRFGDDTCTAILAEHVIEHVSCLQGFHFFFEARRVLEPGGTLRIAFPDVARFLMGASRAFASPPAGVGRYHFGARALEYSEKLAKRGHGEWSAGLEGPELARAGMLRMLTGWGHQMTWTHESAAGVLLAAGFSAVERWDFGEGKIACVDGHHRDVGPELAQLETTILEATK